jgi:hypothetical protein
MRRGDFDIDEADMHIALLDAVQQVYYLGQRGPSWDDNLQALVMRIATVEVKLRQQ